MTGKEVLGASIAFVMLVGMGTSVEERMPNAKQNLVCRSDYEDVPNMGCYRLYKRGLKWDEAMRACEEDGTKLAVPDSRKELKELGQMQNRADIHFNNQIWVGIRHHNNSWRTLDGEPLGVKGFTGWSTGEPTGTPQCAIVRLSGLFDRMCNATHYYICEQP